MSKLLRFLKPYWLHLLLIFIFVYVQVMTDLVLPDYMAKIINDGIIGKNLDRIYQTGREMLLISLLGGVCMIIVSYLASKVATGFSLKLREATFSKVESFSLIEFNAFSTASLITRSTNDIQQVQMILVMFLRLVLMAPIMGIGAILKAYHTAPSMSWIIALAVTFLIGVIIILFTLAVPKFKLLQKLVDQLNLITRQSLVGLRVIRAFNNQTYEADKFDQANQELTDANLYVNRLLVIMQPMMIFVLNITSIGVVWIGAHFINTGNLQIGDMMAFMQYAMQVIFSFLMISIIFIMFPRASVSAARIAEVLETEPTIKDPASPAQSDSETGIIEFKDVSFTYPGADAPALSHITFTAKPGETTAFIGSTGSGKSTLINLIPRFYDATAGQIFVDGVDVRKYYQEDLYRKIGYVPQKGILFSGDIASNIKYGNPKSSDQDMATMAQIAAADEFIEKMPERYKSSIAQGGTNVSGGQKQRLSIARALLRHPEIYLFDDSFSALDFKTDAQIRQALKSETATKTVLIVAQRISTILQADQIIVLDEGEIVGQGDHKTLLQNCRIYREIAASQLSDAELTRSLNLSSQAAA